MSASSKPDTPGSPEAAGAEPADATGIAASAARTLAGPSARIALGSDFELNRPAAQASPGPVGRLVGLAARTVWDLASGGKEFGHSAGEGFLEPAARRYMVDFGHYAQLGQDGVTFGGRSGRSLQTLRPDSRNEGDVLWLLRLAAGATDAHPEDPETLRGTLCRKYAVRSRPDRAAAACGLTALVTPAGINSRQPEVIALTVWTDGEHIRKIRFEDRVSGDQGGSSAKIVTLELWDFGVPVEDLDWSRLPTFRTP